jgi:MerR family transcriptional regulator, light-induced transcriptional regulator
MAEYSIKEVETLSGVKAHTLRIWEQRYHFLKPNRTDTNIRYYNDEQLRLLLNIATLNRSGMKISKIAGLNKGQLNTEVLKVFESTKQPDNLLDSLIHSMLDFDEKRFGHTLSSAILKLDFEEAFTQLIFPFLIRTGVLWATGAVRVVQEHFITNLIRRKLYVAIDGIYAEPKVGAKKFILFLPEGETHELILLFTEYLLRKNGHEVAYLGCSLPFNELGFIAKAFKPDYMVVYQTISTPEISFNQYLKNISSAFPKCKIIVGGQQISEVMKLPVNCTAVHSAAELLQAIL